ncbi:hypothetical protein CcaCcLH18_04998 [Colletotrichum camelliae]|nr:hypothetical protein CcaCcLH18_04998 [Colletotrichum camelliae]
MDELRSSIQSDDTLRSEISSLSSPSICDDSTIEEQTELFQHSKISEAEESLEDGWTQEDHTASHSQLLTEEKSDNVLMEKSELICDDVVLPIHRSKWVAVDSFSICILGVGTSFIIGVLIFLSYIWNGSMRAMAGDNMEESFWSQIVFSDWTSRTVTVAAAILRICLSLQMGVFTAMIASLMIEKSGVPLNVAPSIALLRAMPASPWSLFSWTALSNPCRYGIIYKVAIGISVLLAITSQFASTVLLTDFSMVNVTASRTSAEISYAEKPYLGYVMRPSKAWSMQPGTYSRFAEKSIDLKESRFESGTDYEDTGPITRAIMPIFSESQRTGLRRYDGPAAVLNSRVFCMLPVVRNLTFEFPFRHLLDEPDSFGYHSEFLIQGEFGLEGPFAQVSKAPYYRTWSFNCVVTASKTAKSVGGQRPTDELENFSICSIFSNNQGEPFLPLDFVHRSPPPTSFSNLFLMFKSTGTEDQWIEALQNDRDVNKSETKNYTWAANAEDWEGSNDGIWAVIRAPQDPRRANNSSNISISMSACFAHLDGDLKNVSLSSNANGFEAPGRLELDNITLRYNTDAIRKQHIWSSNMSADARGLLTLDSEKALRKDVLSAATTSTISFRGVAAGLPVFNAQPCAALRVDGNTSRAVHYAHSALFQDVMIQTGRLTEALQAILMVTQQMEYYEWSRSFNQRAPGSYIIAEGKSIPVRWIGFSVVVSIICVHFILLTVATALFLYFTEATCLGNIWMSLSQVVSVETADIIQSSTYRMDSEVKKVIQERTPSARGVGLGLRHRVRVMKNEASGRDELLSF